jgi:hypothetical protein
MRTLPLPGKYFVMPVWRENTLPELLTKSCALRRRKAAAIELFKLL